MLADKAQQVVRRVSYKRDWYVTSYVNSDYQLELALWAIVEDSNSNDAPYYGKPIRASHSKLVDTSRMLSDLDVYSAVMDFIIEAEIHEAREYFKVGDDYKSPFHPHNATGVANWRANRHHYEEH